MSTANLRKFRKSQSISETPTIGGQGRRGLHPPQEGNKKPPARFPLQAANERNPSYYNEKRNGTLYNN